MSEPAPQRRPRVLVTGGGVASLEAVLALDELAPARLDVALLTPRPRFEYSSLSVAEPFGLGRVYRVELAELLRDLGVETIVDALEEVDAGRREVRTAAGLTLRYDALLVAVGARRHGTVPGAIAFSGTHGPAELRRLLLGAAAGRIGRLVFTIPPGVTWALPAYELALMAGAHFAEHDIPTEVALVTPEPRPLDAFGDGPSGAVDEMLRTRRIAFHSAVPVRAEPGLLVVEDGAPIPADAVVALPRLMGPQLAGLPADEHGFLPVDEHGRVRGVAGVYAAGDVTSHQVKQGGLAAQQADAAAEAIAADLGEAIEPRPFRPVLRGLLLTGRAPRSLRTEIVHGGATQSAVAADERLGWPPAKIAGRRLAPFLALHGVPPGAPPGTLALELAAAVEQVDGRVSA